MFCEKCGALVNENDKFCQKCGAEVQHNEEKKTPTILLKNPENTNKLKANKKRIVIVVSAVVLILFVFNMFFGNSNKEIRSVKGGNLEYYPEVTLGEAFENWFSSPKWSYDSKTKLVQFSGECTYGGKPATMTIDFRTYDNGVFETNSISVDDTYSTIYFTDRDCIDLYSNIFEDAYKEKGLEPPMNMGLTMDLYDYFFN